MGNAAALDVLRARIRTLEGGPRIERRRGPSGVEAIDALLGGIPIPGILEITGAEGAGRTRLALDLVAASRNLVAWVDPLCRLYPPAAAARGVALERLLVVRPIEDGSSPWVWTTEQLLRSGNFPLVVVDLPPRVPGVHASRRAASHAWARAVEHGQCTAVVIARRTTKELPADVRIAVGDHRLTVLRDRGRLQLAS
jgi:recombination protein RecA